MTSIPCASAYASTDLAALRLICSAEILKNDTLRSFKSRAAGSCVLCANTLASAQSLSISNDAENQHSCSRRAVPDPVPTQTDQRDRHTVRDHHDQ